MNTFYPDIFNIILDYKDQLETSRKLYTYKLKRNINEYKDGFLGQYDHHLIAKQNNWLNKEIKKLTTHSLKKWNSV